jgi:4-azaleucine resistance transporter AzlC
MVRSALKSYIYGIKKSIPVFFGFLPVAITFAILAAGVGMNTAETTAMSVFVFAGASQIMAVQMMSAGAGAVSIIIATFVLNLRHLIMSTCVFGRVRIDNFFVKLLAALAVTDEGFALITTEDENKCDVPYVFGVITLTYLSWIFGTVIGAVASNILPSVVADSFGIALYALFIALIVPNIKRNARLFITVLLTAIINTFLMFVVRLDSSWSVILSTLVGAAIGIFIVKDDEAADDREGKEREVAAE